MAAAALVFAVVVAVWQSIPEDEPPSSGYSTPPTTGTRPTTASQSPGTTISTPPTGPRKAQVASHASGARVTVPAGPAIYSPAVAWTEVETPTELESAPLVAPVLQFDSHSGLVFDQEVAVDLPAGEAGENAVVMVWSRLGSWLPLPSQPVTLANGEQGRRVVIDREPTPWTFSVWQAEAPAGDLVIAEGMARWEQLRWTDKGSLQSELQRRSSAEPRAGFSFASLAHAATPDLLNDLAWAYRDLLRVSGPNDFESWVSGLKGLQKIRNTPNRENVWIDVPGKPQFKGLPGTILSGGAPLNRALESLLAQYAPWGLDYTLLLIEKGVIAKGFDLRVLEPVGQLDFADADLPSDKLPSIQSLGSGPLPWEAELDNASRQANLDLAKTEKRVLLRLYSSRMMKVGWTEWLLGWGETSMRWLPVIAGLASAAGGNPAGFGLLWDIQWLILNEEIDWLHESYDTDAATFSEVSYGTAVADDGGEFLISYLQHQGLFAGSEKITLGELKWQATKFIFSAALTYGGMTIDIGHLKEIRRISQGQVGYCEGACSDRLVPPMTIHAVMVGEQLQSDQYRDLYPRYGMATVTWAVDYSRLYGGKSLHDLVRETKPEYYVTYRTLPGGQGDPIPPSPPYDLPIGLYRPDRSPTSYRLDTMPHEQLIRFGVPAEVVMNALQSLGRQDRWDQVDIAGLGLSALVYSDDGHEKARVPLKSVAGLQDDSKEARYAGLVLFRDPTRRSQADEVPEGYGGPSYELGSLRQVYSIDILDGKDRKLVSGRIDFRDHEKRQTRVTGLQVSAGKPAANQLKDIGSLKSSGSLKPGVWNLGEGFPREVLLKMEGVELVARYQGPDGETNHRVVFRPAKCDYEGGYFCFEARFDQPSSLSCTVWDYAIYGASVDGLTYEALYMWRDDCTFTDPNGTQWQNDPASIRRMEVKGKWLREGGPVDSSYPPVEKPPSMPQGTNPLAN